MCGQAHGTALVNMGHLGVRFIVGGRVARRAGAVVHRARAEGGRASARRADRRAGRHGAVVSGTVPGRTANTRGKGLVGAG